MEKYLINYKTKAIVKKPKEYCERISNVNNQTDVRLTFMNCKGFVTQKNNQHKQWEYKQILDKEEVILLTETSSTIDNPI